MIESTTAAQAPMPPVWLSVLVPAHDVEPYLEECLDSIVGNIRSLPNGADTGVELVILDDGSQDKSPDIIAAYRDHFPELIVALRNEEAQGVSAARNALLRRARGKYVWFVDSDDVLAPDTMKSLFAIVERVEPDYIICDYATFSNKIGAQAGFARKTTFEGPANILFDDPSVAVSGLFEAGNMHPWSKVHKRALYGGDFGFPVGKIYEDIMLMPFLAMRAKSYFYCPEVWVLHRKRPGSLISTPHLTKVEDKCFALVACAQEVGARRDSLSRKAQTSFYCFMGRHLRVIFKSLARWPQTGEATKNYRNVLTTLGALPGDPYAVIVKAFLARGRLGRLLGFLVWKRAAQKRLA